MEVVKRRQLGFTIAAIVGSYPFAGFFREEALQTIDFGVRTAKEAGDFEGEKEAIEFQEELLNTELWEKIVFLIPYVNVSKEILGFIKAARIKYKINRKSFQKRFEESLQTILPTQEELFFDKIQKEALGIETEEPLSDAERQGRVDDAKIRREEEEEARGENWERKICDTGFARRIA